MKKLLLALLLLATPAFSQQYYAYRIHPVTALPATCNPANGEVVSLTSAGLTTLMNCVSTNLFKPAGVNSSGQIPLIQGNLAVSTPAILQTATWTAAGVTYDNLLFNVTDTASAAASRLLNLQIGGNSVLTVGKTGNITIAQGALTADVRAIDISGEWNNAAIGFTTLKANFTDTASTAATRFLTMQVGGVDKFFVTKAGALTASSLVSTGDVFGSTGGVVGGTGRWFISSTGSGQIQLLNGTLNGFDRLQLGGPAASTNSVAWPAIVVSPAVGGQTQGIILNRGDGTTQVQANLGAATNGSMIYCSDCTVANPCAGGGTGAIAKRLNGAWVCN